MKYKTIIYTLLVSSYGFSQNTFPTGANTNVGIGTLTPGERLEVIGNLKAETGYFYKSLPNNQIFSSWEDRNKKCQVLTAGTITDNADLSKAFTFFDFPSSNYNPTPEVFLTIIDRNNNGRFAFNAEASSGSMFRLFDKSSNLNFKINDDGNNNILVELPKSNSRLVIGGDFGNYLPQIKFLVKGDSKMEGNIVTDSNIGIGTYNFTDGSEIYRLSVDGNIRAKRVKVYTTWADFVFDKNYGLPTLEEVERHIQQNGHLKDIPSASEVEKNGIELGEMNKKLLQKIEELTLYVIELNKELKQVKQQLNSSER